MSALPRYYLGLDIAAESFSATVYDSQEKKYSAAETFSNQSEGVDDLQRWLKQQGATPQNCFICLEATGVYAEFLCYNLASYGYSLAVEAPHKTKRAFLPAHGKTDALDSRFLAEYAYRFFDQLTPWQPNKEEFEKIKALLATRELFSQQLTANKNNLHALQRKYIRTTLAENTVEKTITHLKEQIQRLDREIKDIISNHPTLGPTAMLLLSVPGVGWLLTANILLAVADTPCACNPRHLAAHLGICPFEHSSGSSVQKRPRSRRYGPARLRKLIYLAAMSLRTHNSQYQHYFARKVAEGKSRRLVLNNIANKLLRVICAVLRSKTPFITNYKSVHPAFSKIAA